MNEIPPGVPFAAPWSLSTGAFGRGSVVAAVAFFLLAAALSLRPVRSPKLSSGAFVLGCLSLFASFGSLALLFVKDQFQYEYVWRHSDTTTSVIYKIASVWTAQEGSFLLWGCTSALFALLALRGTGPYRNAFVGVTSLFLGTIAGILAYETPFKIMPQVIAHGKTLVPAIGNGMEPLLQNYWVTIHPPTIFLGFGSLSLLAAYSVAAMLHGDASDWIPRVRPWALLSMAILGLGVVMGGLWAYETQGWGGFWAWDPVENVSLVPWIFVVAFVHGVIVQAARAKWAATNLLLGGVPFLVFVYGTYLTRSGLLTNVSNHSFATMDDHARGILKLFLLGSVGLFGGLFAFRGRAVGRRADAAAQPDEPGVSREGFYRYGMLFLSLLAVVISLGMSWPVVTALRGGQGDAVKEPLYHLVVTWFFLPLMALMAAGPFVSWRRMEWKALRERLFGVACVSFGLTGLLHLAILQSVRRVPGSTVAAPFGWRLPLELWMLVLLFSVVLVVVANAWRIADLARRSPLGTGGFVAHLGLAVLMGGLILSRGYEQNEILMVREGSPASGMGYTVAYKGSSTNNFFDRDRRVEFDVTTPEGRHFVARPTHFKSGRGDDVKDTVWPAIERSPSHDTYLAMSPPIVLATEKPVEMKPGDSVVVNDARLEYLQPTTNGKFGAVGAEFGAKLRLTQVGPDGESHQYLANPSVRLEQDGLKPVWPFPRLGPDLLVALVGGVDASSHATQVALMFNPPIYQIELFEKPFTGLIWAGMGILTLGGLMSAFARRRRAATLPANDAPLPTA